MVAPNRGCAVRTRRERTGGCAARAATSLASTWSSARGPLNLNRRRSEELRLDRAGILCDRITTAVAIPGGVHMVEDVMQSLVDGAKAARMTAALLKNGVPHLMTMRADIEARMEKYACPSIHRRQAIMRETSVAEPAVFGRADCMKRLWSSADREPTGRGRAADLSFRRRERARGAILNERGPPWWKARRRAPFSTCGPSVPGVTGSLRSTSWGCQCPGNLTPA
jgi:hypothetical protein